MLLTTVDKFKWIIILIRLTPLKHLFKLKIDLMSLKITKILSASLKITKKPHLNLLAKQILNKSTKEKSPKTPLLTQL